jgi:hypothetical protein
MGTDFHLATAAACVLPVVLRLYGTRWSAGIYCLAAVFFVLEVRRSHSTPTLAAFVIALLAGIGALLRVGKVEFVYYPAGRQLVVSAGSSAGHDGTARHPTSPGLDQFDWIVVATSG